ncbi:MAG: glycosyltransferase family 1 protein [Lachnospiraceae bacterium]|nr:glycosyltransferase family 1 protein [Lachnospiraceae bacterium]
MKLLLFHRDQECYNTLNIFADSLAREMDKRGIFVSFIDLDQSAEKVRADLIKELDSGTDAVLMFNADGRLTAHREILNERGIHLFDWIVDHPCEHTKILQTPIEHFHAICLDRDHVDFIKTHFPNIRSASFLPIGGDLTEPKEPDIEEFLRRPYSLVFTGSYVPLSEFESTIRELPDRLRKMAIGMIEYMLDHRSATNEEALRVMMREVLGTDKVDEKTFQECAYYTSHSNIYVRQYVREELIRYLIESGITIDIFGVGWENLGIASKNNVRFHGSVSYFEASELCAKSRMALNVMPWFKNGLHDRIPTTMLNGAAVFTDTNRYLEDEFHTSGAKQELCTFDIGHPEQAAEIGETYLKDPERLFELAKRGNEKAVRTMTWEKRTDELLRIIASAETNKNRI